MGNSKVMLADGTVLMDTTGTTVTANTLLSGYTALDKAGNVVTGAVVTAPASTTTPKMDGTAAVGTENAYARGDHVHPAEIFVAEYGTTTYAQVQAAVAAGKTVIARQASASESLRIYTFAPLVTDSTQATTTSTWARFFVFRGLINLSGQPKLVSWRLDSSGWSAPAGEQITFEVALPSSGYVPLIIDKDGSIYGGTLADIGALGVNDVAGRARRLQEVDSRNVNDTPSALISDSGMGVFSDFKTTTVINTGEAPTKAFYQVISFVPWSNDTGGLPVQLALANKGGVPLIYGRSASSTSAWGSWKKLAFTDSDITGNAATADSAATLSDTLGVGKGGTGKTSFTANQAIISGSTTTGAFTSRAITNNTATSTAITGSTNLVTMNTLRYAINRTTSVAAADANYTTYMTRGVALVSSDTTPTNNGEIAWVYG